MAVRALIPLLVARVAATVVVASALGCFGHDLVLLRPAVADTPTSATNGLLNTVTHAGTEIVKFGFDAAERFLVSI